MYKYTLWFVIAALFLNMAVGQRTHAQTSSIDQDWQFAAEMYIWGASEGGGPGDASEVKVDSDDVLDSLEAAFMGTLGTRKSDWVFVTDFLFLDLGADKTIRGEEKLDVGLEGWVVNPMVAYTVADMDWGRLDILGDLRYLQ